jgi:hypothetical protein
MRVAFLFFALTMCVSAQAETAPSSFILDTPSLTAPSSTKAEVDHASAQSAHAASRINTGSNALLMRRSGRTSASIEAFTPPKSWFLLMSANHASAGFDAWSTRRLVNIGGKELNPLLRPVADSNALYPVMQAFPALTDLVAYKMMGSRRGWVRKMWWVPQVVTTAGSVTAGLHNMRQYSAWESSR